MARVGQRRACAGSVTADQRTRALDALRLAEVHLEHARAQLGCIVVVPDPASPRPLTGSLQLAAEAAELWGCVAQLRQAVLDEEATAP